MTVIGLLNTNISTSETAVKNNIIQFCYIVDYYLILVVCKVANTRNVKTKTPIMVFLKLIAILGLLLTGSHVSRRLSLSTKITWRAEITHTTNKTVVRKIHVIIEKRLKHKLL